MAAPVVRAPSERIFGSRATYALEDPNRDPLVVIDQLRSGHVPDPYLQPVTDLPGRVLARLVGPVAAYNVLVLSSFPLAAAAAYLLGRFLLGSHVAALVAGLAYAFLPFHVAHATAHPHVAQTQWLPLFLLALWACVEQPDAGRGVWLVLAAAAVALSNFYGGLVAGVLAPVALLAYGLGWPRRGSDRRGRGMAVAALVLAATAAAGLLLARRLTVGGSPGLSAFAVPRSDVFLHSARWWSYLLPPVDHPLWGARVRELWTARGVREALLEQQVGVGVALLVLAMIPLWLRARGERMAVMVRGAPALATVAVAALLCSLSPERRIGSFTLVRPSSLLFELAPMFRAYARFGLAVGLMVALLAGAGATLGLGSPVSARRRATWLLLGLAVLELAPFPPWRWRDVLPTRAHRWLARQPGPVRALDCVGPTRVSDVIGASLAGHEVSLLGPQGFADCGEPWLADRLAVKGYTEVLVRRDTPVGAWLASRPTPEGLARGPEFEDSWILDVKPRRPDAYVEAWLGFYPREYDARTTWRWMGQTGALRLVTTRGVEAAVLDLDLASFPATRRVQWLLDGHPRGDLEVSAEWHRYELPLGALPAGEAVLTLASAEAAIPAREVLGNDDPRPLAVAVGNGTIHIPPPSAPR